jgi:hypothetical protein
MTSRSVPVVVKVFGLLHIIFGSFGLVAAPFGFLNRSTSAGLFSQLGVSPIYLTWFEISLVLGPILSLILIVLGIGLLRRQSWARSGSILYSVISIILTILSTAITLVGFAGVGGETPDFAAVIWIRIGAIIGGVIGLIYPILTIIFMTKPNVKAALN